MQAVLCVGEWKSEAYLKYVFEEQSEAQFMMAQLDNTDSDVSQSEMDTMGGSAGWCE